jgi:hypothetical protein
VVVVVVAAGDEVAELLVAVPDEVLEESSEELEAGSSEDVLEELVPDPVAVVVPAGVPAAAVEPGISLDTRRPSATAAPAAKPPTALAVRRARVLATSRRMAPACVRPAVLIGGPSSRP